MGELIPLTPSDTGLASLGQTPPLIAASGPQAEQRFWEFFTVTIRNPNVTGRFGPPCGFLI